MMKTSVGNLALIGAVLIAGSAMAQAANPGAPGRDSPAPAESRGGDLATGAGPTSTTGTGLTYTTGDFTSTQLGRVPDPRETYTYIKIDAALPLRACTARRGEIVRREGVQQCRLPAAR